MFKRPDTYRLQIGMLLSKPFLLLLERLSRELRMASRCCSIAAHLYDSRQRHAWRHAWRHALRHTRRHTTTTVLYSSRDGCETSTVREHSYIDERACLVEACYVSYSVLCRVRCGPTEPIYWVLSGTI